MKNTILLKKGLTLIELTVVILVTLTLAGVGLFSLNAYSDWKKGSQASQILKSVYVAQRLYLADNPTASVSNLTHATLLSYLQGSPAQFPTIEGLDGQSLTIDVAVSPPVISGNYDPSTSLNDSLWDVGNF